MSDGRDLCDLPFDPATMDIACRRDPDGRKHFNIPQAVVHHSPTGMEWGYDGGGPADFALNILALLLPWDGDTTTGADLFQGWCSREAWFFHQHLKLKFIATLPHEGGTISGSALRDWIAEQLRLAQSGEEEKR